jgi:hypothetical protein
MFQETTNKKKYLMRVCNRLLIKLRMSGIDPTEASCFFGSQAEAMLGCTPNFGPRSAKVTVSPRQQLKKDVWLMRGFYPGTPQMFKISIAHNEAFEHSHEFFVKVSEPMIRFPTKKNERGLQITARYETEFDSTQIRDQLNRRLENEVLGLDHGIDVLVNKKAVFTPKCMSPKGMPIYRLNLNKE